MAENDWLIGLSAGLDEGKSRNQLNADIKILSKNLDKLELLAEIKPGQINELKKNLKGLEVELSNVIVKDSVVKGLVGKINNELQKVKIGKISIDNQGAQIGKQISQDINKELTESENRIEKFRKSLRNIDMKDNNINAVVNDLKNLDVQITKLSQSVSEVESKTGKKKRLNVEVEGLDKMGQAVKFVRTWDTESMDLIKALQNVSSAEQKSTQKIVDSQEKIKNAYAARKRELEKIKSVDLSKNAKYPVDPNNSEIASALNAAEKAMSGLKNAGADAFVEINNRAKDTIANLQNVITNIKNANYVATSLRTKDISTVRGIEQNKASAFFDEVSKSPLADKMYDESKNQTIKERAEELQKAINNAFDSEKITKFLNNLDLLKTKFKALNDIENSNSKATGLEAKSSALKTQIKAFESLNPKAKELKITIGGVDVSLESLASKLENVKSNADYSSLKSQFGALKTEAENLGLIAESDTAKFEKMLKAANAAQTTNKFGGAMTGVAKSYDNLGDSLKTEELKNDYNELIRLASEFNAIADDKEKVTAYEQLDTLLKKVKNDIKEASLGQPKFVSDSRRLTLANTIEAWNQKNTAASKSVIRANEEYIRSLRDLNTQMEQMKFDRINDGFKRNENTMRGLGRLGASFRNQLSQAAGTFTQWLSVSSAVMLAVSKFKEATNELKEVNTYLVEISKANDRLSKSQLEMIGKNSFGTASKYGKKASDYLSGVQEMSRAGYENAEAMGELSVKSQGAGDMTDEVANKFIVAADKAYKLNGSVTALTKVMDGINNITNHNAINMTELSEGFSVVGSTAASFGVKANELAAALGTMGASTQQAGSEVSRAFRAILLNIRQVSDEEEGINAEGLTKYENACKALGVSLKETKNGVNELRDPMEVLEELSKSYVKLSDTDIRKVNLLNSVGGKLRSTQLDALLRGWEDYKKMLKEFDEGSGSMDVEAKKTANSREGSLKRLSNTWTETIGNIEDSDGVIATVNALNTLLSVVKDLTSALGSFGTFGAIGGMFLNKKLGRNIALTLA